MQNEKIYEPEVVQDAPFPVLSDQTVISSGQPSSVAGNTSPVLSPSTTFPIRKVAVDLISQAMNTKSKKILQQFELQNSGGFKIGDFEQGVSGDIQITPSGLVARNSAGITTISIDGDTGDAVFAGQIQTGTVIAGTVVVGNNRILITLDEGGNPVILVNDGQYDRVQIGFGEY